LNTRIQRIIQIAKSDVAKLLFLAIYIYELASLIINRIQDQNTDSYFRPEAYGVAAGTLLILYFKKKWNWTIILLGFVTALSEVVMYRIVGDSRFATKYSIVIITLAYVITFHFASCRKAMILLPVAVILLFTATSYSLKKIYNIPSRQSLSLQCPCKNSSYDYGYGLICIDSIINIKEERGSVYVFGDQEKIMYRKKPTQFYQFLNGYAYARH